MHFSVAGFNLLECAKQEVGMTSALAKEYEHSREGGKSHISKEQEDIA